MNWPTRLRFRQFSLRSVLIVLTLCATWLGYKAYRAKLFRDAASTISEIGGLILHEHEIEGGIYDPALKHPVPDIIRAAVGDGWFETQIGLSLQGLNLSDEDLQVLANFDSLRELDISVTPISDKALEFVSQVPTLELLYVYSTRISDQGLRALTKLQHLRHLDIRDTLVTDHGLDYLGTMSSLKRVSITKRIVTQKGVDRLSKSLPECEIEFK